MHKWTIAAIWITWGIYWAANGTLEITAKTIMLRVLIFSCFAPVVLFASTKNIYSILWLTVYFIPYTKVNFLFGIIITAIGLVCTMFARYHLGNNWKNTARPKPNGALIQSGCYSIVRHPIYAGFTMALFGTMISTGALLNLVVFVIAIIAIHKKILLEEVYLIEKFPVEYKTYTIKVTKKLIPKLI
jgi:protein-S-isoprenylcysteine O-methyltransferase Ste14